MKSKLYIRIQCGARNHTIIRIDSIPQFKRFLSDPDMHNYFRGVLLDAASGSKKKVEPFLFEVEQDEFNSLVTEIKRKISSQWKNTMNFSSISIVEDSRHMPMIRIVVKEIIKEEINEDLRS